MPIIASETAYTVSGMDIFVERFTTFLHIPLRGTTLYIWTYVFILLINISVAGGIVEWQRIAAVILNVAVTKVTIP